jgi:transposase-like protein
VPLSRTVAPYAPPTHSPGGSKDQQTPRSFIPANNPIEADHGRLKARLRPMRGLKRLRSAAVIAAGHAFVQNLRRGHYELATDAPPRLRLATALTELALAI